MQLYNSKGVTIFSCENTSENENHQIQCVVIAAGEGGKGVGGEVSLYLL